MEQKFKINTRRITIEVILDFTKEVGIYGLDSIVKIREEALKGIIQSEYLESVGYLLEVIDKIEKCSGKIITTQQPVADIDWKELEEDKLMLVCEFNSYKDVQQFNELV